MAAAPAATYLVVLLEIIGTAPLLDATTASLRGAAYAALSRSYEVAVSSAPGQTEGRSGSAPFRASAIGSGVRVGMPVGCRSDRTTSSPRWATAVGHFNGRFLTCEDFIVAGDDPAPNCAHGTKR